MLKNITLKKIANNYAICSLNWELVPMPPNCSCNNFVTNSDTDVKRHSDRQYHMLKNIIVRTWPYNSLDWELVPMPLTLF